MKRSIVTAAVAVGLVAGMGLAAAMDGSSDDYVASLNADEVKQELGLKEVRKPEDVANRLEVVFQDGIDPDQRAKVLQKIGNDFLMRLFENPGITTVTIVERDGSGAILNQAVVNLTGPPTTPTMGSSADP